MTLDPLGRTYLLEWLRAERIAKGLEARDADRALRLSPGTVAAFERGARDLPFTTVLRLLEVYGLASFAELTATRSSDPADEG